MEPNNFGLDDAYGVALKGNPRMDLLFGSSQGLGYGQYFSEAQRTWILQTDPSRAQNTVSLCIYIYTYIYIHIKPYVHPQHGSTIHNMAEFHPRALRTLMKSIYSNDYCDS